MQHNLVIQHISHFPFPCSLNSFVDKQLSISLSDSENLRFDSSDKNSDQNFFNSGPLTPYHFEQNQGGSIPNSPLFNNELINDMEFFQPDLPDVFGANSPKNDMNDQSMVNRDERGAFISRITEKSSMNIGINSSKVKNKSRGPIIDKLTEVRSSVMKHWILNPRSIMKSIAGNKVDESDEDKKQEHENTLKPFDSTFFSGFHMSKDLQNLSNAFFTLQGYLKQSFTSELNHCNVIQSGNGNNDSLDALRDLFESRAESHLDMSSHIDDQQNTSKAPKYDQSLIHHEIPDIDIPMPDEFVGLDEHQQIDSEHFSEGFMDLNSLKSYLARQPESSTQFESIIQNNTTKRIASKAFSQLLAHANNPDTGITLKQTDPFGQIEIKDMGAIIAN